ncbi:MAG: hypothetical protein VYC50_00825 [Pseudomonadota bacterium]|nr:hypothetical protein [Pseudomonadota bacterium]
MIHRTTLFLFLLFLFGCGSNEVRIPHQVSLNSSINSINEEDLLDVSIVLFDSGVPEGEIDKELLEELINEGTFVHIRRTESRYMATHLRDTLQNSGYWGSVWVTPDRSLIADLEIMGKILHSDGDRVSLDIHAVDASGRTWLKRNYQMFTAAGAFNRNIYPDKDPYQDIFNRIANDLAVLQVRLEPGEGKNIRRITELRFAEEISPESFQGYLNNSRGRISINRLPSVDDPQFNRIQRARDREHAFIETLNEHYVGFYNNSTESYDGWREYSREESIAIKELESSSRWRTGIGVATIVASIVYDSNSDGDFNSRVIRDTMMYTGVEMIKSAGVRREEKRLHTQTLEELSLSFDDEVMPMVIQIEGTQHRLTGTADAQYQEWKDLLLELYKSETGFESDVDIFIDPLDNFEE